MRGMKIFMLLTVIKTGIVVLEMNLAVFQLVNILSAKNGPEMILDAGEVNSEWKNINIFAFIKLII